MTPPKTVGEISCHLWRKHDDENREGVGESRALECLLIFNEYLKLIKFLHIDNNSMVDNLPTMCFDQ